MNLRFIIGFVVGFMLNAWALADDTTVVVNSLIPTNVAVTIGSHP